MRFIFQSDDNASHLTLSISSVESFPPPDIQSQEEALGGYFKSQEREKYANVKLKICTCVVSLDFACFFLFY